MLQTAPTVAPAADTTIALYDTMAAQAVTVQSESPTERAMLAENKLPVVLAVVLIVWAALMLLALRTDRRLARIERALDAHDSSPRSL
ncbi:MAG TPA: hypothetical protein VF594_09135 [Rubricoccaceae bacterium]|jgi:hypothetical protein